MQAGEFRVLAINPGSASTKFAVYANERLKLVRNLSHSDSEMASFLGRPILDQLEFRQRKIEAELRDAGYELKQLHAVAGRGGMIRPLSSGTYKVNEVMLDDLRLTRYGEHASNLGAFLAQAIARKAGVEAYIVDPVSVDEWTDRARISGSALVERFCMSHTLNTKAVARRYAREQGRTYPELRLVVAHLGSGISVSAHQGGRMIDFNSAGQEGTFSTERSGGLPLQRVIHLCFSGKFTEAQLWNLFHREGGIYSYLGTKDLREVERRIANGDGKAMLIFDAMVYQVSKDIGAMATVLNGRLDAILLTGGMAHSDKLVEQLRPAIQWIAPVVVYPGEDELQALAEGALRVLRHEEQALELEGLTQDLG
jgi:butyrate kinase